MKRFLTLLLAAGMFVSGYAASKQKETRKKAQELPITVNNIKVRVTPVPLLKYESLSNGRTTGSRHYWAQMEVDFTVDKPANSKQDRAYWFDDVTMEGVLAVSSTGVNGEPLYVVYTGKTRFYCIARDNKRHDAMFAVPGPLLDRYYTYSKGFSHSMFIAGKVAFYDGSGRLLGEGFWQDGSMGRKDTSKVRLVLDKLSKGYSDVIQVRGGLYSKNRTPWANYKIDRYELINENISGGASDRNAGTGNDNI